VHVVRERDRLFDAAPPKGPTVKAPTTSTASTTSAPAPASSTLFGGLAIVVLFVKRMPRSPPAMTPARRSPAARAAGYRGDRSAQVRKRAPAAAM
jgi:hypothetical protein